MDEWYLDRITEERNETWNEAISAASDLLLARIKAVGRKPVIDELERAYEAVRALKR